MAEKDAAAQKMKAAEAEKKVEAWNTCGMDGVLDRKAITVVRELVQGTFIQLSLEVMGMCRGHSGGNLLLALCPMLLYS